ncbi:MAG: preprotein translocase subunit SecE [Candidatus Methylomirabilis sp.]|nr:preprotein translocase subunit SecE [Deltaproteobacteria bacterium]
MAEAVEKIKSGWDATQTFLREFRVEFRKVTWPSRDELRGSTIAVLLAVAIVALYLGLSDFVLSKLLSFLFGG